MIVIGYLFVNSAKEIKTITGRNMPEIYFSRKEAEFVKRNDKVTFKGWKVKKVMLKIASKPFYPKGKPPEFEGERLDIQMSG